MLYHVLNASSTMFNLRLFKIATTFKGNHSYCDCSIICKPAAQHVPKGRYVKEALFHYHDCCCRLRKASTWGRSCTHCATYPRLAGWPWRSSNAETSKPWTSQAPQVTNQPLKMWLTSNHGFATTTTRWQVANLNEDGHTRMPIKTNERIKI